MKLLVGTALIQKPAVNVYVEFALSANAEENFYQLSKTWVASGDRNMLLLVLPAEKIEGDILQPFVRNDCEDGTDVPKRVFAALSFPACSPSNYARVKCGAL